ncbi:hypothetical protein TNIN_310311 [Trichonephila inaurata madagascariensis]|uniref:Uncharacterized protein n=1 Tax=Trichonephila inaurata madagascariensis TaxID=2747483 RepID=A0A8X6YQY9_9ARAC|nr:hypothetical protein TNIN_310311 [Trichonephila inaurata madagascariensis]
MNCDDSDLFQDDYQGDNGSEMDDDDEDQDVTFDFLLQLNKEYIRISSIQLSIANTLIHGLLKKSSPTPSQAEDENVETLQNAELRLALHIKQLTTMKLGTCLKWLGKGILEVGAGMRSARS